MHHSYTHAKEAGRKKKKKEHVTVHQMHHDRRTTKGTGVDEKVKEIKKSEKGGSGMREMDRSIQYAYLKYTSHTKGGDRKR